MSETKEPYKWYCAYTSTENGQTYAFDTLEKAREHAMAHGEFDEICGKDYFIEHEQNLFFDVREDELKEYALVFKLAS